MIDKEKVVSIIEKEFEGSDLFLVDVNVGKDNKISVFIDGDSGVSIKNCVDISRIIEENFDREEEDFELSVLSFGVGEPLMNLRQYKKNIGRYISIITNDDLRIEGELIYVDEDRVRVFEIKKNKKHTPVEREIAFPNIKEGKIIVIF